VTVPLLFDAPGVAKAQAERVKLLSQIDDYLLPRLRQSGAPILVALVGSTGAGKSTLMNSLVGKQVSATGIRRPTTNSPVLACHPDDARWFAENVFLPTLPRVRQQGLAMPGRDGLLVLAASDGMPKGVALLDTPDIDSVVEAHHEFAHQFLDASDLWLFVTTARRYADAAVWEMLKDARDRGAALAVALSRVPPSSSAELAAHFDAMLEANGLQDVRRFIIPETIVTEAKLPGEVAAPVGEWLADTARRDDRRVAVLTQTMSGVLDTFRSRVPALADQVAEQLELRQWLRETVDAAYATCLEDFDEAARDGSLLQGEVQARWQDFAGAGDLLKTLQVKRGRGSGKQRRQRLPARASALAEALLASVESLIAATADRAAELVVSEWRGRPAGARLLADLDAASPRGGTAAESEYVTSALADLGLDSGTAAGGLRPDSEALARATAGLTPLAERLVASWQEYVLRLVKDENVTKRSVARVVSFDHASLALVLSVGVLSDATPDTGAGDAATRVPGRLLASLLGAGLLRDLGAQVRRDLRHRVSDLFEAEARRYFAVIDAAGIPADAAAAELLQAGYALEAAR
jgi:GTPase SAR1 family protein